MGRRYRRAKRAMRPNRIAARFISGGKHQTFKAIVTSPWKHKTVTNSTNRRKQYRAHQRRERQKALAEKRRAQRAAQQARKKAAAAKKATPRPSRVRKPNPPIAVNPHTGKPITWAQAQKALREAQERAERLAAGLPGDPPAKRARAPKVPAKKIAPARAQPKPTPRPACKPAKPRTPRKKIGPAPDPSAVPGKNLRGVYLAVTCPCQGTGRIAVITNGMVSGSVSCPTHGRTARGQRKTLSRRAMTDAGLPGVAGWLASRKRGNLDAKQRRAVRQAGRKRQAGPTLECRACDQGIVNRPLTDKLRADYIARILAECEGAGERAPSRRKLAALARKAYPYDHCRQCRGLGRVPSQHAGDWHRRTDLPEHHRLTAREAATGKRPKR
jgi:hypothetical protein